MSKQGSTLAGVMDAFSVAVSIALQYGVPLEAYVSKFINMRFEPAGLTDDPDVRMAQSVMDYLFRRLALDYLPYERAGGARHLHRRGADRPDRRDLRRRGGRPRCRRRRRRGVARLGSGRVGRHARTAGDGGGAAAPPPAQIDIADRGRRAAVLHLRRQHARGRQLLRLRAVRQHERMQLMAVQLMAVQQMAVQQTAMQRTGRGSAWAFWSFRGAVGDGSSWAYRDNAGSGG